jgi:hypothetical protein
MAAKELEKKTVVPAKIGFFGGTGSGKTTTAAELALGISLRFHDKAPVYVYDTEPGWQFTRRMFATEGVELIQVRERSFQGMRKHLKAAEKTGACAFVVDSMTHVWNELMQTFAKSNGRVEFQQFNLIKRYWNEWTVEFLNSPLHAFALGRLGYEYDAQVNEDTGKKEIVKGDSKFKAGGGESFGYEPHLLIEMELSRDGSHNGRGGALIHTANVLKDRTRILNGESFDFKDGRGYKAGDYRLVFDAFLPHVEELQYTGGLSIIADATSSELRPESESDYFKNKQNRDVSIEKIEASMTLLFPGQSADMKSLKLKILDMLFGTRSWKEITEKRSLADLDQALASLMKYEGQAKPNPPSTEDGVLNLLTNCMSAIREEKAAEVF